VSTRANIVISDDQDELWFYRHSDGYPEGAQPMLDEFVKHVNAGHIRDNVEQASGWLIIMGHHEYDTRHAPEEFGDGRDWKCGAIEPCTGQHGDIEYLYRIDLSQKPVTIKVSNRTGPWDSPTFEPYTPDS